MTTLPGIGQSVIVPVDFGNSVRLPSDAAIGGSPPPAIPSLRLASAASIKGMFNPVFAAFNRPQNTINSV